MANYLNWVKVDNAVYDFDESRIRTYNRVSYQNRTGQIKSNNNAFTGIFRLLFVFGYPFSPDAVTSEDYKDSVGCIGKAWCILVGILRTILLVMTAIYCPLILPSATAVYTAYGFYICEYVNMWIIYSTRKTICGTVRRITRLMSTATTDNFIGNRNVTSEIFLVVFFPLITFFIMLIFYGSVNWKNVLGVFRFVLRKSSDDIQTLTWMAILSFITTHSVSMLTNLAVLLNCRNVFYGINDLLKNYGKNVKSELSSEKELQKSISRNVLLFRNIDICVQEMDKAFSSVILVMYGAITCNLFGIMGIIITKADIYGNSLWYYAYAVWTILTVLYSFLSFTLSGAGVLETGKQLRDVVLECTEKIMINSPEIKKMESFSLLLESVSNSKIEVSAWGMFIIDKGLILSVAGVLITYGLVMYEF